MKSYLLIIASLFLVSSPFVKSLAALEYSNQKSEFALSDPNQAIAIKPNDIAVEPHNAEAYNNRGLVYYEQGKLDLALAEYNRAIALNPNLTEAYIKRGVLYYKKEN